MIFASLSLASYHLAKGFPMKALPFFLLITISTIIHAETRPSLQLTTYTPSGTIYHEGWIDFNKNGKKDVYEDPSAPVEARIENLLQQMTMEEKTCQMVTLYGYRRVLAERWNRCHR